MVTGPSPYQATKSSVWWKSKLSYVLHRSRTWTTGLYVHMHAYFYIRQKEVRKSVFPFQEWRLAGYCLSYLQSFWFNFSLTNAVRYEGAFPPNAALTKDMVPDWITLQKEKTFIKSHSVHFGPNFLVLYQSFTIRYQGNSPTEASELEKNMVSLSI